MRHNILRYSAALTHAVVDVGVVNTIIGPVFESIIVIVVAPTPSS